VDGPLAFVSAADSPLSIEVPRLQRLLLAYYRILQANRELPRHLLWSLSPLSLLIWTTGIDNGVRLLAIRCYALQSGMGEAERETVERATLGELCVVDCPVEYGHDADGNQREIDAWILPVLEARRIQEMRKDIMENPQTFYEYTEGDEGEPLVLRCVLFMRSCILAHIFIVLGWSTYTVFYCYVRAHHYRRPPHSYRHQRLPRPCTLLPSTCHCVSPR
jgi:hypothetical protein